MDVLHMHIRLIRIRGVIKKKSRQPFIQQSGWRFRNEYVFKTSMSGTGEGDFHDLWVEPFPTSVGEALVLDFDPFVLTLTYEVAISSFFEKFVSE